MKITESSLRRIIREVIAEASDVDDQEAALHIKKQIEDLKKQIKNIDPSASDETYLTLFQVLDKKRWELEGKLDDLENEHRKNSR
jgi:SpoVK/Ycf46/Vps4 family AAA+-type ATPase